jgi:DNA-directed RNA polymerase omega subunit
VDHLPEGVDSRFRYVLLVAKRAEQLIQGAQPKMRSRHTKPSRVAMEEIDQEVVRWQLHQPIEEENPIFSDTE